MNKNRVSGRKKYIWFEYRVRLQILKKLLLKENFWTTEEFLKFQGLILQKM